MHFVTAGYGVHKGAVKIALTSEAHRIPLLSLPVRGHVMHLRRDLVSIFLIFPPLHEFAILSCTTRPMTPLHGVLLGAEYTGPAKMAVS